MKIFVKLLLFFTAPFMLYAQQKINASAILHQAELKRMPWEQMSLYATFIDSNSGASPGTSYHVFFDSNKALVACTAPSAQKGNLLLLQNHEMWFYIKSTAQPMKITPLQRLSGSVSFVDIARLNWTVDYSIDSFENVKVGRDKKEEAYLLHLHAISPDISYKKINLWVDKSSKRPVKADIYLSSEKLYKTIFFTKYQTIAGKEVNTQIEFIDYFNKGRKSVITFSKPQQEKNLPEHYFSKEKMPEVSKAMIGVN
jgi:outer membrane lipoprotein-sorting protein